VVVGRDLHRAGSGVVEEGEGDLVLRSDWVADDDLVDVVELVPIFFINFDVAVEGLELGASRDRGVEGLGGEEGPATKRVRYTNDISTLSVRNKRVVAPTGCSKGPRGALRVFEQLARFARSLGTCCYMSYSSD